MKNIQNLTLNEEYKLYKEADKLTINENTANILMKKFIIPLEQYLHSASINLQLCIEEIGYVSCAANNELNSRVISIKTLGDVFRFLDEVKSDLDKIKEQQVITIESLKC